MTPTTSTAVPPRTADSPLSGSPAGAPSPAESSSLAGRPSARSPESASSWSTTSSRARSLYSTETTRPARSITGAGPLLSRPSRPALYARPFHPPRRGAKPPTP